MTCNLLLHQGSSAVSRDAVADAPTPKATRTWQPLPHIQLLETVERSLNSQGLSVVKEAHGLTHDRCRYFGLLEVVRKDIHGLDYAPVVGVRNSHDKRFPAGVCCGSAILICDNLAFYGQFAVARKHTAHVFRDLPYLVHRMVGQLEESWQEQDERMETYRDTHLLDSQAHDLTVRALDAGVICASRIPSVLEEWREPRHEAFRPRTLWSWLNACTEVLKGALHLLPARTQGLYGVCDAFVGIN